MSYIIWKVFESTFWNWFCPSVCTYHDLQTNSGTLFLFFYVKCLILYINGFVTTSSTNKWKAFFKFYIRFQIFGRKPSFFKRIALHEYWSNCYVLYINGFVSTNSINQWKAFFSNFEFVLKFLAQKPEIFQKNSQRGVNIDQIAMCYIAINYSMEKKKRIYFQKRLKLNFDLYFTGAEELKSLKLRQYQSYFSNW